MGADTSGKGGIAGANLPEDVLSISDDDFERMLKAAVECYGRGDAKHAETILVGLIAVGGADSRPFKILGSSLLLQGRHAEAERVYDQALARDPADPYTLVNLAELKLQAMQIDAGVSLLEKLFALPGDAGHPAKNRGRRLVHEFHKKLTGAR